MYVHLYLPLSLLSPSHIPVPVVVAAVHPASAAAPLLLLLSEYQLECWLPFPLDRFHSVPFPLGRSRSPPFPVQFWSSVATLTLLQFSLHNLPGCDSRSTVLLVDANAEASIDPVDSQLPLELE